MLQDVLDGLRRLQVRVANSIARGVVTRVDDGKKQQLVQAGVLAGEPVEGANPGGAEHFHPYGFSSIPLEGAEVVVVFPNGDRSHPLVIACSDRRYRPVGGQAGEVTVYNHTGAKIKITKDGDIIMSAAPGRTIQGDDGSGGAAELALKSELDAVVNYIQTGLTLTVATTGTSTAQSGTAVGATSTAPTVAGTSVLKGK